MTFEAALLMVISFELILIFYRMDQGGDRVRLVYGVVAMIAWFYLSSIMFTNTFLGNSELALLTLAIVFAGAMAGGD